MKYYAVVIRQSDTYQVQFTYNYKDPFITTCNHIAEKHLQYCQENWPNENYQIVEFDVGI